MTADEIELLRYVIETGNTIRPLGDVVPAKGLQSAGMATVVYLDEGARISVRPTDQGRRWIALINRRSYDSATQARIDVRAQKIGGRA